MWHSVIKQYAVAERDDGDRRPSCSFPFMALCHILAMVKLAHRVAVTETEGNDGRENRAVTKKETKEEEILVGVVKVT